MKASCFAAALIVLLLGGYAAGDLFFDFNDGTFQGWWDLTAVDPDQTEGPRYWQNTSDHISQYRQGGNEDSGHPTLWLRSPEFKLTGTGNLTVWLDGGNGYGADATGKRVADVPAYAFDDPSNPVFPSFLGIALRNVNTGVFDLAGRKNDNGGWQSVTLTASQLAALDPNTYYTLDLIDARQGGWGWVSMGDVTIPGISVTPYNPTPADGAVGVESGAAAWSVPLSIVPAHYNVYLGTDLNPDTLVGTVADSQINLGQFPLDLGYGTTWYWQVEAVDPNEGGEPVLYKGQVWSFTTLGAEPIITRHPPRIKAAAIGETIAIQVEARCPQGDELTYAWYRGQSPDDSDPVADADQATLLIDVEASHFGTSYYCRVTTDSGSVDSTSAMLREKKMLAHWPLNNLDDPNSLVAGTPQTIRVGTPILVDGPADGLEAMYFDGSAGFHTTASGTGDYFNEMYDLMSVSVWIKSQMQHDNGWRPFVGHRGENGEGWQIRRQNFLGEAGFACFTTRGVGSDDFPFATINVYDNTWRHLVGTFDGTTKRIYLDGFLNNQVAAVGAINPTGSPVGISLRYEGSPGNFHTGALYDVRLYNYALSKEEVAALYVGVRPGTICAPPLEGDANNDCRVDLLDLAILSAEWLECTLFPDCADVIP